MASPYETLRKFSEALDTSLLCRQAEGEIGPYALEVIPDDGRVNLTVVMLKPVKNLVCTVKLGGHCYETDHSR